MQWGWLVYLVVVLEDVVGDEVDGVELFPVEDTHVDGVNDCLIQGTITLQLYHQSHGVVYLVDEEDPDLALDVMDINDQIHNGS